MLYEFHEISGNVKEMVKDTTISLALGYHEMRSNRPHYRGKKP